MCQPGRQISHQEHTSELRHRSGRAAQRTLVEFETLLPAASSLQEQCPEVQDVGAAFGVGRCCFLTPGQHDFRGVYLWSPQVEASELKGDPCGQPPFVGVERGLCLRQPIDGLCRVAFEGGQAASRESQPGAPALKVRVRPG